MNEGSTDTTPLWRVRRELDRAAAARLGAGYACTVIDASAAGAARLILYVTSQGAVRRAKDLSRELAHDREPEVRVTSRRFAHGELQRIKETIEGGVQRGPSSVVVGMERAINRDTCPRVRIMLEPRGAPSENQELWAARMQRRHGRDRVVVVRGTGAHLDAD